MNNRKRLPRKDKKRLKIAFGDIAYEVWRRYPYNIVPNFYLRWDYFGSESVGNHDNQDEWNRTLIGRITNIYTALKMRGGLSQDPGSNSPRIYVSLTMFGVIETINPFVFYIGDGRDKLMGRIGSFEVFLDDSLENRVVVYEPESNSSGVVFVDGLQDFF